MSVELTSWKIGLLFAAFCVLLGLSGLLDAREDGKRRIPSGIVLQGLLMMFVVGGHYFRGISSVAVGGVAILGLLLIQTFRDRMQSLSSIEDLPKDAS